MINCQTSNKIIRLEYTREGFILKNSKQINFFFSFEKFWKEKSQFTPKQPFGTSIDVEEE